MKIKVFSFITGEVIFLIWWYFAIMTWLLHLDADGGVIHPYLLSGLEYCMLDLAF